MSELNLNYIADLRRAVVEAICNVSADRQSEGPSAEPRKVYIGTAEVCQTLTIVLAEFLEGKPDLVTPGDVRRMSETIAKKLRLEISDLRRHRAETGGTPLTAMTIRSN